MTQENETKAEEKFRFEFDAEADRRKAFPYACRFYLDGGGNLEREFFDFDRDFGTKNKNKVRVSGTYEAAAGDVVEECTGGSWKNKYRETYLVSSLGELLPINGDKPEIRKFLKGQLAAEDFVYPPYRDRLAGGRQQRLESERERIEKEIQRLRGELGTVETELEELAAENQEPIDTQELIEALIIAHRDAEEEVLEILEDGAEIPRWPSPWD